MTQLYLASGSPRRKELLAQTGVIFERIAAPIDETPRPNENPRDYVIRMAVEKAESGWRHLQEMGLALKPVLASDTSVVLGDEILGKPLDAADATAMLSKLSGSTHEVLTSLALRTEQGVQTRLNVSRVQFAPLSAAQIAAYVASGEPMDKAGAYGIQGIGGLFVAQLEGSYTGVMGLPLHDTAMLLAEHGLGWLAQ
ncbi:nucleoside triphosphate pyrophosphatase [Chitinibacter sp. ZOR0017]|uniref:Maf family protein n=1 Tax=Chitinibacter sp. ZOR0017 TaxID=1339254 RepID=UPI000647D650|nr:Maf family protein [Chitinibacter sp. ZOR0017]